MSGSWSPAVSALTTSTSTWRLDTGSSPSSTWTHQYSSSRGGGAVALELETNAVKNLLE